MTDRMPVSELDLLAYADGLLETDPVRRAAVEEVLRASPETSERVRLHMAQTKALRQAYSGRLAEPVPDRLHEVLDRRPAQMLRPVLRTAAVLCLTVGTGFGGWLLGTARDSGGWSVSAFVERSHTEFLAVGGGLDDAAFGQAAMSAKPLGWLAEEMSIRLRTPDLSPFGFTLVGKQAVRMRGEEIVRLDYAAADGRSASLFLAPRWEQGPREIVQTERDGVSLAWWLDGPLASSIVTRMPAEEAREIAEAVRRALRADGSGPIVIEPEPVNPRGGQGEIMADTHVSPAGEIHPQLIKTLTPGQVQQN